MAGAVQKLILEFRDVQLMYKTVLGVPGPQTPAAVMAGTMWHGARKRDDSRINPWMARFKNGDFLPTFP
jgi:hypothetical protein